MCALYSCAGAYALLGSLMQQEKSSPPPQTHSFQRTIFLIYIFPIHGTLLTCSLLPNISAPADKIQ